MSGYNLSLYLLSINIYNVSSMYCQKIKVFLYILSDCNSDLVVVCLCPSKFLHQPLQLAPRVRVVEVQPEVVVVTVLRIEGDYPQLFRILDSVIPCTGDEVVRYIEDVETNHLR